LCLLDRRTAAFAYCVAALLLNLVAARLSFAQIKAPLAVRVWQDSTVLPTSEEGLPDPNPPFDEFRERGPFNYPYTLRHSLVDRRTPKKWRTLNLENEYLKCTVLPDLGGHLYTCIDKVNGRSMFYANPSIKFARIAYRGMWAALGVEFNFPVSHNWMTVSPVDFATTRNPDGSASIWVGNIDQVYGMQWRVQLTLHPGRDYLEQKTTLYNVSETRHRFYWWTNAGVQVWDDSRIFYPMEFTAAHGFADIDTWPVNSAGVDQSIVGNHKFGPVSRFSYGSREPYMAVYHPHSSAGVVHYSSPLDLPAKKIWSWGSDPDGLEWRSALSDNNSAYVEIQAGLFRNQETYGFLNPEETRSFTEFWIPIRDLGGVTRANPDAVLNLNRHGDGNGISLDAVLNVTRYLPNAVVEVLDGTEPVASAKTSLSPRHTWRKTFPGLSAGPAYTLRLRSAAGEVVLEHTEGKWDFTPRAQVHVGKQPAYKFPPEADFGADDFVSLATEQESNGELPIALNTYQRGLGRFPDSIALARGAGRLEVTLQQYTSALTHLFRALARISSSQETAYYLGLAEAATGDERKARTHLEFAQQADSFRAPALLALAALEARSGYRTRALTLVEETLRARPHLTRAGAMELALLRSLERTSEARKDLDYWLQQDPTSSLVRWEAVKLGAEDASLLAHLAGDPQRILEIATEYMNLGLYADALDVLSQKYPTGPDVIREPGTLPPDSYPLVAYFRGYCAYALGQDGRADFEAASHMPTTYVFPHRRETLPVLERAIRANPQDATAHFLLGSLYLSSDQPQLALEHWETARQLKPSIPTLQRNMGYTLLFSERAPDRAIRLFLEGTKYDSRNVDVYLGLEEAMKKAGRPASERARALESYPDMQSAPAALVFRTVEVLDEAAEFDAAEKLLEHRFFAREEGGKSSGEVYAAVRLEHAAKLASQHDCTQASGILETLTEPNATVPGTAEKISPYTESESSRRSISEVHAACR